MCFFCVFVSIVDVFVCIVDEFKFSCLYMWDYGCSHVSMLDISVCVAALNTSLTPFTTQIKRWSFSTFLMRTLQNSKNTFVVQK